MKSKYLLIAFLAISCGQKAKEKQGTVLEEEHNSIIAADSVKKESIPISKKEDTSLTFDDAIDLTKTKGLPQKEATDFDSFIDEADYEEVDVQLFNLEDIYPDFYKEGYNYRAIAKYKLALSNDFHSVVITVEKGDNEMESVLITYDKEGNSIDHEVVSYDEIVEGMFKTESKIERDSITINHISWGGQNEKQVETALFRIKTNGEIVPIPQIEVFYEDELTDGNSETVLYTEYVPEILENVQIGKFSAEYSHQLDSLKVLSGYSEPENGQQEALDTNTDWGHRLLLLDSKNEIMYKSQGVGDVYLFEPHFYKSDTSDKIIIICQMAYEYPFGGEVFILEKGNIKNIGILDIEGYDKEYNEESYLTEVVKIRERSNRMEFIFKADSLVLEPGTKDIVIKNNNIIYVYENNQLTLKRKISRKQQN